VFTRRKRRLGEEQAGISRWRGEEAEGREEDAFFLLKTTLARMAYAFWRCLRACAILACLLPHCAGMAYQRLPEGKFCLSAAAYAGAARRGCL